LTLEAVYISRAEIVGSVFARRFEQLLCRLRLRNRISVRDTAGGGACGDML